MRQEFSWKIIVKNVYLFLVYYCVRRYGFIVRVINFNPLGSVFAAQFYLCYYKLLWLYLGFLCRCDANCKCYYCSDYSHSCDSK